MRRVSGNPAKRAGKPVPAGKKRSQRTPVKPGKALSKPRKRILPASRAGKRLTMLATWVALTAIVVPAGWFAGRAADDQYLFIMTSLALPVGLAAVFSAVYFALAIRGGLSKIPRLGFDTWPKRRRRTISGALGVAAAAGLVNLIWLTVGGVPVGLLIAALLGAAAAVWDIVKVARARRRFVA